MKWLHSAMHVSIVMAIALAMVGPAAAKEKSSYQTGFTRWRAADNGFTGWALSGITSTSEGLVLNPGAAAPGTDPYPAGSYYGINFYNAGSFQVGEAISPVMPASFNFTEAIASWNATTPAGTWLEVLIQAQLGGRWTKWYNLGIWASDSSSSFQRHSVRLQGDGDGFVAVDTLVLTNKKATASAFQLKLRLFSEDGAAVPSVRNMSVAYSTSPGKKITLHPGNPAYWNTKINVPACSQMIYPDGGNVWCSPTSTSMVLGFWGIDSGPCEPRVRAAVEGVYDVIYDGHGNWPFNTAYAADKGMEAYVARFTSMAEVEKWVAAGVPVVVSYAFGKGDLTGAPIASSSGHLAVVVGFDPSGDVVVNDPAAASDAAVRRTYLRAEFEQLWLEHSGGTVYLIFPPGTTVPEL